MHVSASERDVALAATFIGLLIAVLPVPRMDKGGGDTNNRCYGT